MSQTYRHTNPSSLSLERDKITHTIDCEIISNKFAYKTEKRVDYIMLKINYHVDCYKNVILNKMIKLYYL